MCDAEERVTGYRMGHFSAWLRMRLRSVWSERCGGPGASGVAEVKEAAPNEGWSCCSDAVEWGYADN